MKTTEAMARLVRANPVDSHALAESGRSPRAQAALDSILAAPTQPRRVSARKARAAFPPARPVLVLATVGAVAVSIMVYQLPGVISRSGQTGTSLAETQKARPLDPEMNRSVAGLPPPAFGYPSGNSGELPLPPTLTPQLPQTRALTLLGPGSTYLLTQVGRADIVVVGTIVEASSTPSSGPGEVGFTTLVLKDGEILYERVGSTPGADLPAVGAGTSVEQMLVFRAVGPWAEDIGYRGGLALGDQVVFIGTRRHPFGASNLPGFWLLLGDYSAYREENGVFTRLTLVHDDPMGDSFTLPELKEMLAPYGRQEGGGDEDGT